MGPDAAPSVALAFARSIPTGAFVPLVETAIDDGTAVYVVADWTNLPVDAHEQLELRAPDGAIYASLDLVIAAAKRGDVTFRVLDDGTTRLTYRLAVWGTQIESLPLTGTWSARVTLVGGSESATAGFALR